jgi:uroporphyrinogen decarboxylase
LKKAHLLNSRERLQTALGHHEPDRVPIDLGGIVTGITTGANRTLSEYLDFRSDQSVVDRVQQLAQPSNTLLERLHVDTRYLYLKASRDWQDIELPDHTYQDEFGIRRKAAYAPDGYLLYYDFVEHPLRNIETIADLTRYKWPDPHDPARYAGLEEATRSLYRETGYAIMVNLIGSVFEFSWYMRGFMEFMQDLLLNRSLAEAILDAMLEYQMAMMEEVLARVGPFISVVMTGSDLGTQRAPMISPEVYRRVIWPRYKKMWDFIKGKTQAKLFYHSCGSIIPMIPYLIEGGVDVIHPVQPMAAGMGDRERLKREFGDRLAFWGGFDQQKVLPFGTPDEVREETKKLLDDFMPGGGFVFAAGHNIQTGVPPRNIITLFDTVFEYGKY